MHSKNVSQSNVKIEISLRSFPLLLYIKNWNVRALVRTQKFQSYLWAHHYLG